MQTKRTDISYEDYAKGLQTLSAEDQLKLLELISANLRKMLKTPKAKHSIMELEGLGAEIWEGIDAQEYVRTERQSWEMTQH